MDVTKSERFEQLDRLLTEHDGMLQTAQLLSGSYLLMLEERTDRLALAKCA